MTKTLYKVSLKDVYVFASSKESAISKFANYANISADGDAFDVIEINTPEEYEKTMAVDML